MKHQRPSQFSEETSLPATFPAAEAWSKGASIFGRSFATMQKEGLRFFNQRMEENMKVVEGFAACKSVPDVLAVQQKWFADMTRAYTEEWQRCSEMMSDMARENTEDVEAEVRKQTRTEHAH